MGFVPIVEYLYEYMNDVTKNLSEFFGSNIMYITMNTFIINYYIVHNLIV